MSARDVIAGEIAISRGRHPDECVHGNGWLGTEGAGFECSMTARQQAAPVANAIVQALTAAGYRILAPGELDAETLERVAEFTQNEFQRDFESPVGWRGQFVAAIRALKDL